MAKPYQSTTDSIRAELVSSSALSPCNEFNDAVDAAIAAQIAEYGVEGAPHLKKIIK